MPTFLCLCCWGWKPGTRWLESESEQKETGREAYFVKENKTKTTQQIFPHFFCPPPLKKKKKNSKLLHRFDNFLLAYRKLSWRHLIYRFCSSKIHLWNEHPGYLISDSRPTLRPSYTSLSKLAPSSFRTNTANPCYGLKCIFLFVKPWRNILSK